MEKYIYTIKTSICSSGKTQKQAANNIENADAKDGGGGGAA